MQKYYICQTKVNNVRKNKIILQIRGVYIHEIEFKNAIQKVHLGFEIKRNQLNLQHKECQFGKWYYNEGQYLNGIETFRKLEKIHEKVHRIFQSIYKLSFDEVMKDDELMLVSNSIHLKKKKSKMVNAYCKDFLKESNKLLATLKMLYNDVAKIPNSFFNEELSFP
jgi:hypothetical protein